MCGILGWAKGKLEVEPSVLRGITARMFLSAQSRGVDATGFAFVSPQSGRMEIMKSPVRAVEFIKNLNDVDFEEPKIFIGHTRAGTHGSPKNNENNHPLFSKESRLAITHNGIIRTDKKLKTDGEVDSEIILRLIEAKKTVVEGIRYAYQNYWGSASFAVIGEGFPETLYLVRDGNPLCVAYVKELDLIIYASTEGIIRDGLKSEHSYFGYFSDNALKYRAVFEELEDDTMLVITRDHDKSFRLKIKQLEDKRKEPWQKWSYGIPSLEEHNKSYGQRVMFREDDETKMPSDEGFDTEAWREQP